ncbi:MAG: EVE domain-containing protein [Thermoflexales bacterium]|nr:EVE domain-containing protein [Thermoflexales bacterium]
MRERKCWIIVACKNHVANGVRSGIAQANHGKAAPLRRMQVGDGVIYYSSKIDLDRDEKCQEFTAIGQVTGESVYQFDMGGGFVPFRRDVTYFNCVPTPIQPLIPELSFIREKKSWGYVFRFGFFEIPQSDFDLIARHLHAEEVYAR